MGKSSSRFLHWNEGVIGNPEVGPGSVLDQEVFQKSTRTTQKRCGLEKGLEKAWKRLGKRLGLTRLCGDSFVFESVEFLGVGHYNIQYNP